MQNVRKNICLAAVFFLLHHVCPAAVSSAIPIINRLQSSDPVFRQYTMNVESSYKAIAAGKNVSAVFFQYKAKAGDRLISLAARCSIPYETIALLNHIPAADTDLAGKTLFLPDVPGLFIPFKPLTPVDYLLVRKYFADDCPVWYTIQGRKYGFIQNGRFSATERAFFLDSGMRSPLPEGVISSPFGMRISPITGKRKFHSGVDLAAPEGTPVLSCRSGTVSDTGSDDVYGKYVTVRHDEKTYSFYAHLSSVSVKAGQTASRGSILGRVGSTGASTGPHLHFEIWSGGKSLNPADVLKQAHE